MKESREFNNILDECLERMLLDGETIEECLGRFPEHAEALEPLLRTALTTRDASVIKPDSEFRNRARYQLHAALREMESKKSRSFLWKWSPRWATALVAVLVLLMASGGTAAAASGSMPDEPLYPVKLAVEQVQLALTPSSLGKAELYAKLADRRVLEIVEMAAKGKPEKMGLAVRNLDTSLNNIAAFSAVRLGGDVVTAPPKVSQAQRKAFEAVPAPAASGQATGGAGPVLKLDRRAQLRGDIQRRAARNSARLRALLETAPEEIKPAVTQAINTSEKGYEKAIDSLDGQ